MKVLVISFAGIGDTLFATPFIHELRANFPDAQIDALVRWKGSRDFLEGNPHLQKVYQKDLLKTGKAEALQFLLQLRRNDYDFSINTHPQSRIHYRILARIVGASIRISHRYDADYSWNRLLVNRALPQNYDRHAVENNLELLPLLGASSRLVQHPYEIYLNQDESMWAQTFISKNRLVDRKLLGIHVGSGGTKNLALRRWPIPSYIELIRQWNQSRPDWAVLLFGGPEEEKDHARILAASDPTRVFHPKTENFRQAAALLAHCRAFVSVDTALMHVAAAMKVPHQVVIETPTWNKVIEPYGQRFVLVPNPAVAGNNLQFYRYDGRGIRGTQEEIIRCMQSVSVESVIHALNQP